MDEGERDLLAGNVNRQTEPYYGSDSRWAALHDSAVGILWGRRETHLEVDAIDAWALRAEVSR